MKTFSWPTQRGFSLIEVLVALLVLSGGLLGLAMLQAQGMKFNTDAYLRTQATLLAYDIIDRMKSNEVGAAAGAYVSSAVPTATVSNCDTTICDTTALAKYDLDRWYKAMRALPLSSSTPCTIEQDGNQHTITIKWMERDLPKIQKWVVEL